MTNKITSYVFDYPIGQEPDCVEPKEYSSQRFVLGRMGARPLVVICMNPSAARDSESDRTINRIIGISKTMKMDGWVVLNTYPERATDSKYIRSFDAELSDKNIAFIKEFLIKNSITEVWGAWGDDKNNLALSNGKKQLKAMLKEMGVKVYYFGTLTKNGNPRHPLQRFEKWDLSKRNYLDL